MVLVLKKNDKAPAKYFALFLCLSVVLFVYLVELRNSNPNFNQLKIRSPNISDVFGVIDKPHNRILSDTINSTMAKLPSVINITDQSNSVNTVIKEQKSYPEILENRYTRMSQMLQKFPWEELEQGAENNPLIYSKHRQRLIDELEPFAYVEPIVPVNISCPIPPLLDSDSINCGAYPTAFLPDKYKQSVKVGHAIQLGFDVDTLEIHLNQIYDLVHFFFIIESTRVHCESFRKKLTWDEINTQPRFSKFRDKGMIYLAFSLVCVE